MAAHGKATVSIYRAQAHKAFDRYLEPYDLKDPRIALKAAHTFRVAGLCDRIARAAGFTPAGIDLAWLCGLLHDIGRFEQLRRWGTFRDDASASHAAIGVDVLFEGAMHLADPAFANVPATNEEALAHDNAFLAHARETGSIRAFVADSGVDNLVRAAVAYHSGYRLPNGLDVRTQALCNVVRDADKIDILRVNCEDAVEAVIGSTEDELLSSEVSPAVEDAFFSHRTATVEERLTPLDHVVNLACFAYELAFPASLEIMVEQGYLFQLFRAPFGIEKPYTSRATRALLGRMDGHLRAWIDERLD